MIQVVLVQSMGDVRTPEAAEVSFRDMPPKTSIVNKAAGDDPLVLARLRKWDELRAFLDRAETIPTKQLPELLILCSRKHDITDRLLEMGGDINTLFDGTSLLAEAAVAGDAKRLLNLIKRGATVDLRGLKNETPLMRAIGEGISSYYADDPTARAEFLAAVKAGADPNLADDDGYTCLDVVAGCQWPACLKLLTEFGATLVPCKDSGAFAIAECIKNDDLETFKMLVLLGADGSMKLYRTTVLELARKQNRTKIVAFLESKMASSHKGRVK